MITSRFNITLTVEIEEQVDYILASEVREHVVAFLERNPYNDFDLNARMVAGDTLRVSGKLRLETAI